MSAPVAVRLFDFADLPAVKHLYDTVQPYRPEDLPAVEAMYARAASTPEDGSWPELQEPNLNDIAGSYLRFWVAEHDGAIAGMVAVRARAGAHPWFGPGRIAELQHLRVAPEARRLGLGLALTGAVIEWSRAEGFSALVLDTTTPQVPARKLYERLGFAEVGRSYLAHKYEVVWYRLGLR